MWRLISISSTSNASRARRYSSLSFGKRTLLFLANSVAGVSALLVAMTFLHHWKGNRVAIHLLQQPGTSCGHLSIESKFTESPLVNSAAGSNTLRRHAVRAE